MAAKKVKISITVDADVLKRVDRLAKSLKENRSSVMGDLLADALEQNEAALKAASDPVLMGAFMRAMAEPGVMRGMAEAVRQDLTDDQLRMFTEAAEQIGHAGKRKKGR